MPRPTTPSEDSHTGQSVNERQSIFGELNPCWPMLSAMKSMKSQHYHFGAKMTSRPPHPPRLTGFRLSAFLPLFQQLQNCIIDAARLARKAGRRHGWVHTCAFTARAHFSTLMMATAPRASTLQCVWSKPGKAKEWQAMAWPCLFVTMASIQLPSGQWTRCLLEKSNAPSLLLPLQGQPPPT